MKELYKNIVNPADVEINSNNPCSLFKYTVNSKVG